MTVNDTDYDPATSTNAEIVQASNASIVEAALAIKPHTACVTLYNALNCFVNEKELQWYFQEHPLHYQRYC
eukprot:5942981-Ditylum_brightwellii.AAC.1